MPLPWMPGVVRDLLLSQPAFSSLIAADRVVFTAPADVATTFFRIQVPNAGPLSGDSVAWKLLVQGDAFHSAGADADELVWKLAATAGHVLSRARNVIAGEVSFSGRHIDGPIPDRDVSRGPGNPLARALVRAELTLHLR